MKRRVVKKVSRGVLSDYRREPGTWNTRTTQRALGRLMKFEAKHAVRHPRFGNGWIESISDEPNGTMLYVRFHHYAEPMWVSAESVNWGGKRRRRRR